MKNYRVKINLKIRMQNSQFWIQIGLAVLAPILAYHGISGAEINTWSKLFDLLTNALRNPFIVFSALVGIYNAVTDPTTPGISDSERALMYRNLGESQNRSNDQSVG